MARWVALGLAAGLLGCQAEAERAADAAPAVGDRGPAIDASPDAAPDVGPDAAPPGRPCPEGWGGPPDDCRPPPLAEDCPAGALPTVRGDCTPAWVCPDGWARTPAGFGCQWPAAEAPEAPLPCPLGEGCRPLACAPDELPLRACTPRPACEAPPPPEDALAVPPGAPAGAVAEALATGRPVVLGAGVYPVGPLVLPAGARLVGACPAETRLQGSLQVAGDALLGHLAVEAPADAPAIWGEPAEIQMLFVDVTGDVDLRAGGLVAEHLDARGGTWHLAARLTCTDCRLGAALDLDAPADVLGSAIAGLHAAAPLTLRDVRVEGDAALDADATLLGVTVAGGGVDVGATAHLTDVIIAGVAGTALRVRAGGEATVDGLGLTRAGNAEAAAIDVAGRLELDGLRATRLAGVALRTAGRGATEARDLDVRDVAASACLQARDDAVVTVADAHLRRCQTLGIAASGRARLAVQDALVADTQPDAQGRFGRGLELAEAAALALTDVEIRGAHDVGLALLGRGGGGTARLTRVAVSGVQPDAATGGSGKGVVAFGGVEVDAEDIWITDTVENGVAVISGAVWQGRRLALQGVARPAGATYSVGLNVGDRADVDLTQVEVADAWGVAVGTTGGMAGDVRLRLAEALATDIRAVEGGRRLCVVSLATGDGEEDHDLRDVVLRRVPECGLSVTDAEATIEGLEVGFRVSATPTTAVRLQRADLTLRDAALHGPATGIRFLEEPLGSTVDVARLHVDGGQVGLHATTAARIGVQDARFDGLETAAIWSQAPAEITVDGLWSRGEGSTFLLESGQLDAMNVDARGMAWAAALVAGADTRLQLSDASLTDFGPPPGGAYVQAGVLAVAGAEIGLSASRIVGPAGFGVLADDSTVGLDGVAITGARPDEEGRADAINLLRGRLVATGLTLADNARAGLVLEDAAGDLRASAIRGHRVGVVLAGDATLDSRDLRLEDNERDERTCPERCLDRPPMAVP